MKRYFPDVKFVNRDLYQYFTLYLDFFFKYDARDDIHEIFRSYKIARDVS